MKQRNYIFICMACLLLFFIFIGDNIQAAEAQQDGYITLPCEDDVPALTTGENEEITDSVRETLNLQGAGSTLERYYVTSKLPQIRNQGSYGSCWAFAASALGEISMIQSEQVESDLSELHLAYFTYHSVVDPLGGTQGDKNYLGASAKNFLQQGGNLMLALQTLANWKGGASENLVPYENCEEVLQQGIGDEYAYEDVAHLKNAYIVNLAENREEAKLLIKQYGGIAASYYSSYAYYNGTYNSYYGTGTTRANHAITIVGWNDDFPKDNFNTEAPEDGAWLVRNSWGIEGENYYGYFWMSYSEKTLTKAAYAFEFVSNQSEEYYDNNYQYDGGIYYLKSVPTDAENSIVTANIFEAQKEEETLEAVSFETYATDEEYEVSIYMNVPEDGNPEDGTLIQTKTGTTSFAGLYTVNVDKCSLFKGEKYSVVVELTRAAGNPSMMMEYDYNGWLVCETAALAGQSYVKENGAWVDYGKINNRNIRIKAYTNTVREELVATEIKLSATEVSLQRGDCATLTAELNGSGDVIWSSDDCTIATIEDGTVKAVGYGIAVITVQAGDAISECRVYVYPPEVETEVTAKDVGQNIVTWKKIDGVDGYQVYRYDLEGEKEELLADMQSQDTITYLDQDMDKDSNYAYYVVAYVESSKGMVESDVSQWSYVKYLISYELDGGTNAVENPKSYYYDEGILALKAPYRAGYNFVGWYSDKACRNNVSEINSKKHDIFKLYARWEGISGNVEGDVQQKTGEVESSKLAQESEIDTDNVVFTGDEEPMRKIGVYLVSGILCVMAFFQRKKRE